MPRLGLIVWLCLGAFGLGIIVLEAARRKQPIRPAWIFLAFALGPIFLFFMLPLWLGRWGKAARRLEDERDLER